MRLASGDNHLISVRDQIVFCQVWVRTDLSAEDGARNARQMVEYLLQNALQEGSRYRGLVFDVRRGPAAFGPKTRDALLGLLSAASKIDMPVAILAGAAPIQVVQFKSLCSASRARAEVFESEAEAVRWFAQSRSIPPK
jgi:hypothetical protein